ncbi:MAG: transcriptional repressor [Verrucomicrobiae bacterium]|nr:transcriptional repressor [Verrucomicrobiae bacterium]
MNTEEKRQRLEQLARALRESGLPMTPQRRAVFESMLDSEDHPTADDVYATVRKQLPEISRMTVYRILSHLVVLRLLSKICHPGSVARYDPKLQQHHHLVCLDCGEIVDLEEERLNQLAWPDVRRFGFEIEDYHVNFRGRCAACRQAANKSKKQQTKRRKSS